MSTPRQESSPVLDQPVVLHQPRVLSRPRPTPQQVQPSAVSPEALPVTTNGTIAVDLREQAWQSGFANGEAAGREDGWREGNAEGRRQGLEEGLAEGLRQGLQQARERLESELQSLQAVAQQQQDRLLQLVQAIPAQLAHRLEAAEDDMVALTHAAVLQVLGEAFGSDRGCRLAVRRQLEQLQSRAPLSLRVHPDDALLLVQDKHLASLAAAGLSWIADPSIESGGCIIGTGEGELDARLGTQLRTFTDLLLQTRAQTRGEGES